MATFVGTQASFVEALQELIELDRDAVEAYEAAIRRLEHAGYKLKLEEFKEDHKRHIEAIANILEKHKEAVPSGPSVKSWLTKGRVVLADLVGDKAILSAMLSNEGDTNLAYKRMVGFVGQWEDAEELLGNGLADEMRHESWLKNILTQL